jgi:ABC-type glutathione transport system ATPase component
MFEVKNLTIAYDGVPAVEDFSFTIGEGEVVGLLGGSGSGKSTVALSLLRLLPPNGRIVNGEILLDGKNLLALSEEEMIAVRGGKIAMIFQDPFTSLNPVLTIGEQIAEVLRLHQGVGRPEALARTVELLRLVQIKEGERRLGAYPHQFSGGMQQRVMIAMALACSPRLLIADEPTTALDVTIQSEILQLLQSLQRQLKLSVLYITHNIGIIKQIGDRVMVMERGRQVESGRVSEVLASPRHPYTQKLIAALQELR